MPQAVSAGAHERLRQLQGGKVLRPAEKEMRGTPFGWCRLSIALSRLFLLKPAAFAAGLSEKANKALVARGLLHPHAVPRWASRRRQTFGFPCRTGSATLALPHSLGCAALGRQGQTFAPPCCTRSAPWSLPPSLRRATRGRPHAPPPSLRCASQSRLQVRRRVRGAAL